MNSLPSPPYAIQVRQTGTNEKVSFTFGHDFRGIEMQVVHLASRRVICVINGRGMTPVQVDMMAKLLAVAPEMWKAIQEAISRLSKARHPNAVALRRLLQDAIRAPTILSEEYEGGGCHSSARSDVFETGAD